MALPHSQHVEAAQVSQAPSSLVGLPQSGQGSGVVVTSSMLMAGELMSAHRCPAKVSSSESKIRGIS
jgi:hypothetical protein